MINLRKHDPIADAVKDILQQEALKGNQHLIDKNKNNKVDAHDFKILRGEKKAVKEEETVEEGIKDVAKKDNKKMQEAEYKGVRPVSNAFTQTAPYPSFKKKKPAPAKKPVNEGGIEEVQGKTLKQFMENAFDYKTPRKPEPNGGSGVKQGSAYGGSKQKDKPEQAKEKK